MNHLEAKKTAEKILTLLDGLSYKDARNVLRLADDKLSGYSEFVAEEIFNRSAAGLAELSRRHDKL